MPQFQKGKKGGPGRPKGSKNGSSFAKDWADRFGLAFMGQVAEGKIKDVSVFGKPTEATLRLRCDVAQYLIDRGYGKPTQAHELAGKDGGPLTVNIVSFKAAA